MGGEISGRRGFIPETVKQFHQAVRARRGGGGLVWLYIITAKSSFTPETCLSGTYRYSNKEHIPLCVKDDAWLPA